MADMNIDKDRAKRWVTTVNDELTNVDALLREVTTCIQGIPGDDDVIMQGIQGAGQKLEEAWSELPGIFREVSSKLDQAVETLGEVAATILEGLGSLVSRIHL